MSRILLACLLIYSTFPLFAPTAEARPRTIDPPSAGQIQQALERLAVVGSVLYVAAHPDDENTRLLSWLVGERKLRAAYASLTRGDGGQNLVGGELGPLLGLIRTYELLAARDLDGAEQLFSRAVDFGYSKTAEETLRIWGEDAILADLVRIYRTFRPDVVVTRFNTEPPNHGHHTASAMLARAAFEAAGDPTRFPEQLGEGGLTPWRPTRLLENKSHWRMKPEDDKSQYLTVDVGTFSALLGRSWGEIAAASRTMHKSQGFGSAPEIGPVPEYFETTAGEPAVDLPGGDPAAPNPARGALSLATHGRADSSAASPSSDPFGGVDFTWGRYPGTERLRAHIDDAIRAFDPRHPERSVPALVQIRAELTALPFDHPWRATKVDEADALLLACAGLVVDARAATAVAVPGETLEATATLLARTSDAVTLRAIRWPDGHVDNSVQRLDVHAPHTPKRTLAISADHPLSTPFWLREPPEGGRYVAMPPRLAIQPIGPPDLPVTFAVDIGGATVEVTRRLRFAWVDRVHGERFQEVEVLPPVTVTPTGHVLMLPNGQAGRLALRVKAHGGPRKGDVTIEAPAGFRVTPATQTFDIPAADGERELTFTVTAADAQAPPADLALVARVDGGQHRLRRDVIDHVHVPRRTVLSAATVRAVPLKLTTGGRRVGYIPGAGDDVAASLRQVGYDVTILDAAALAEADLSRFDAIIAGIRAYNVDPGLAHQQERLMDYVKRGGRYVVQYNVSSRWAPFDGATLGPAPFAIGRGRVTDEAAVMTPIDAAHPALARPNRLDEADWRDWVQERGLYFAETWDARYEPLLRAADPGEEPLDGAVLVARHGKGAFVYTGLAFFRQLPAGVPGAYRLLANLLALEAAR